MNIILTGGHLTPAYAFAEIAIQKGDQLIMIGSAGPNSPESTELAQLGVAYQTINSVKYDRYKKLKSIVTIPKLLSAIIKSIQILRSFKPDVVVTFGSYNAVPVALAAKLLHIPYITHEQTRFIGLANKIIAKGANACAISYSDSFTFFPLNKTVLVGNLLRQAIWHPSHTTKLTLPNQLPILYVTGGNQGSETIVKALLSIVDQLIDSYQIVLQHGKINPYLSHQLNSYVVAKPWFSTDEAAWLYHHAHVVISRAGANTTSELMVAGVPSIIIPLEGSADGEQQSNARIFLEQQAGIIIPQKKCSGETMLEAIQTIEADYESYRSHAHQLTGMQRPDAAISLYQMAMNARKLV